MTVDSFTEKLNKSSTPVPVEEKHILPDAGIYEAELEHDNVDDSTVEVWSGPSLSGSKISYTLTSPEATPWKRIIHVETDQPTIYINYETTGDQVECDDINELQTAIKRTQTFANEISEEIKGGVGYTWGRLMGVEDTEPLKITKQPSDATAVAGNDVTFETGATSDEGTVSYRWQVQESGSAIWTDLSNNTSATYTVKSVTTEANGNRYRCIINDSAGNSITSSVAILRVSS